ncbi:hypothetical protein B0O80DRAFT_432448 [Mortierella sp. GBAus27b]|nr:hypothetical protein BGX31_004934 [Mortierella sp. GBA43]KAI8362998.1 hypothetical protein B0O80DRAFT_432448 [Mortierella sp. GBAus27b]
MSNALDPLRRLVVQLNARLAHFRLPANLPPPAPPHLHAPHTAPVPFSKPVFAQFQVKVPIPSHKDGPTLLAHINRQFNTVARNLFVPEPVRVAAVEYACRNAGRPQIASLLSKGHGLPHQQPRFSVPHGFVKNVGLNSSRGFSSFQPAMNGPVKMMAQLYAKPLGSLPANSQKLSEKENCTQQRGIAKKRHQRRTNKGNKKQACSNISSATIKAFLNRATLVEQQHQIMTICNVNAPITTATAISLARVAGRTMSQLEELPKLRTSQDCPTDVDMCFMLDASPLWHLDTMVSALHTDSMRAPKELNGAFIEDLLQITHAQYQHFLEVSAILQKLVKCPEAREISLDGYELTVHFARTTLFDMTNFLSQLSIDPKSPHFDLLESYADPLDAQDQYFPQSSVNEYYAPSLSDNEAWDDEDDDFSSSLMMYTDSERCSSVVSFATLDSSPWEEEQEEETLTQDETETEEQVTPEEPEEVAAATVPVLSTDGLFLDEEPVSPWDNASMSMSMSMSQESRENLDRISSRILNTDTVTEGYFDEIRGFLQTIEEVNRHSEQMFRSPVATP